MMQLKTHTHTLTMFISCVTLQECRLVVRYCGTLSWAGSFWKLRQGFEKNMLTSTIHVPESLDGCLVLQQVNS